MTLYLVDERPSTTSAQRADQLAAAAVTALVAEARLTPKPGLVDLRGPGAHQDMSVDLLERSAQALRPTFAALAAAGTRGPLDQAMRAHLAAIGRTGEGEMLSTTGGVNTHRGAIWALGLAVAVAAHQPGARPADVLAGIARVAGHVDPAQPSGPPTSNGARTRERYGVPGAVGAARQGFPTAAAAHMALRTARSDGQTEDTARLTALLASIAVLDDTCLLHRGGLPGLRHAQQGARRVLDAGGPVTASGARLLVGLDQDLVARGLSPGGSADMLALALFLDALAPRPRPDDRSHPCRS